MGKQYAFSSTVLYSSRVYKTNTFSLHNYIPRESLFSQNEIITNFSSLIHPKKHFVENEVRCLSSNKDEPPQYAKQNESDNVQLN